MDASHQSLHDYVYLKVANEVKDQTPKFKSDRSSKIILAEYPELAQTAVGVNRGLATLFGKAVESSNRDSRAAFRLFNQVLRDDPNFDLAYSYRGSQG